MREETFIRRLFVVGRCTVEENKCGQIDEAGVDGNSHVAGASGSSGVEMATCSTER